MRFLDSPVQSARGAGYIVEMWYLPESPEKPERWMLWVKNYAGKVVMKPALNDDGKPVVIPVQVTITDQEKAMQRYYEFVQEYIGSQYTAEELDAALEAAQMELSL